MPTGDLKATPAGPGCNCGSPSDAAPYLDDRPRRKTSPSAMPILDLCRPFSVSDAALYALAVIDFVLYLDEKV